MTDIDLRTLHASDVVLHFGGRPNEVDAFTFSNALIALSDALRELNSQINTDFSIEVTIERVGPGSFRAKIGTKLKSIGGLFKTDGRSLLVSLLGTFIYTHVIDPTSLPTIIVSDESVIVQTGHDRVIIPRAVWNARESLKKPEIIERKIAKAFEVMEEDPSVSDFGLARSLEEPDPIGIIERDRFAILAQVSRMETPSQPGFKDERTKITIIKMVFARSARKWEFVWNGIRISAPIKDDDFFTKMESREYVFAQGDILDVTLRIYQAVEPVSKALINSYYEIVKVYGLERAPRQQHLL